MSRVSGARRLKRECRSESFAGRVRRAAATAEIRRTAAWSQATPEEKRNLAPTLFERIDVGLVTNAVGRVVVQPASRSWLGGWRTAWPSRCTRCPLDRERLRERHESWVCGAGDPLG